MIPDSSERTVKIPIQLIDGQWRLEGSDELPRLDPNTYADLLIKADFIIDEQQRKQWSREIRVEFLEAATKLFARVNLDSDSPHLVHLTEERKIGAGVPGSFVEIVLNEDVGLTLTPGKRGRLVGGKCVIPCMDCEEAYSLNEAYSKIVREFEPNRRSDTGNVFTLVFLEVNQQLVKLDKFREFHETMDRAMLIGNGWNDLASECDQEHMNWSAEFRSKVFDRLVQAHIHPVKKKAPNQ